MTDLRPDDTTPAHYHAHLKKRHRAEKRFRAYGVASLLLAMLFLLSFFYTIVRDAAPAMRQTEIALDIHFDPAVIKIDPAQDEAAREKSIQRANYSRLIADALKQQLPAELTDTFSTNALASELVSTSARYHLMKLVKDNPELVGSTQTLWLPASGAVDTVYQNRHAADAAAKTAAVRQETVAMTHILIHSDRLESHLNTAILTNDNSRSPQDAGLKGALLGSFYTLLVTLVLSFPIAVFAAIYLEEFAPKNRFTDFLEANINNLAAVPSIVFGLLGLAVFINFFGLPRSTPLVGGLVLTLMTLPTIIISSRAALKAVPPSIRSAALGLGASKMQVIFHHVLPLALPGMLTGTIIGMAQALGETAPLLMIGMVAFIANSPGGITDPAAVMPVQIYLWAGLPESAFVARTSLAILILLAFLVIMNALAIFLRKKFERKW